MEKKFTISVSPVGDIYACTIVTQTEEGQHNERKRLTKEQVEQIYDLIKTFG